MQRTRVSTAIDLVIALGLFGLGLFELWGGDLGSEFQGPDWVNVVMLGAAALPLLWRRSAPLQTLFVSVGVSVLVLQAVYDLSLQPPFEIFIAYLIVIYSLGSFATGRDVLIGAAFALVAIGSVEIRGVIEGRPAEEIVPSLLFFGAAFGLGRALHSRDRRAAQLEAQAALAERTRDEEKKRAIEEERARIARELHDVIAHSLSVIVVQSSAERRVLGENGSSTAETLASIEQTGRDALSELRRLLGILRKEEGSPKLEPQPGMERIDALLEQMKEAGVVSTLDVRGERRALPPGLDLTAYRILQESLTNVLKHSGDRKADLRVEYGHDALSLEIRSNGVAEPSSIVGGQGLIGMRERVSIYGGTLEAGPSPDGAFTVRARLPIAETA